MTDTAPIVIIGGGHNGLVCAAYLARAGRKVLVLEASAEVGGAAVTREFTPGFRVSSGAHLLYALDPAMARDLRLAKHGLALARSGLDTVALADGEPLVLNGAIVRSGQLSDADRTELGAYVTRQRRYAALLAKPGTGAGFSVFRLFCR